MSTPQPRTVLIADDDPDTLNIVAGAIQMLGHTVVQAADGAQAVAMFKEHLPDVVVLDVMMPKMNGIEVCEQIKGLQHGDLIPVMMLTARDTVKDKVTALQGGADDYLTKPFHYQELQARVNALLRVRELNLRLHEKNEELQSMQQKIVEQERQLLANQLGGTAAHQLGQPLSAIILNCHLLERVAHDDERYNKALGAIKNDAKRMAEMLEKLKTVDANRKAEYFNATKILDVDEKK